MATFILLLCFSAATALVNPIGPTITSEYSQCILSLAEDNFRKAGSLVVANTFNASASPVAGIRSWILRAVHGSARHTLQVVSPDREEAEHDSLEENVSLHDLHFRPIDVYVSVPSADYYVIIVGGLVQFKEIIMKLSTLRTWNPRAIFIVMCFRFYRPGDPAERYPELMLYHLFLLNVVNAVVMLPDFKDRRKIRVYGWYPFDPPTYCGYKNESAAGRLIVQNVCNGGIIKHHDYMFKNKIPKRMGGCSLEAIALVRRPFVNHVGDVTPGIERSFMDEIGEAMNFKFWYSAVHMQRGERNSSGEWTGALAQLKAAKVDFVFGAVFPDNDVHEDYEASISYFSDSYAWVVPRAAPSPPWLALVIIFDRQVWFSALVVYALGVATWRLLGEGSDESRYHRTFSHCALNAWYTTLGGSAYMRPLGHSLRLFFIIFTLYCVLFLTAYQTKLIDVLTNPSFEAQLATPAELVRSRLRWGGLEELNDLYEDSDDALDAALGAGYVDVEDVFAALTDVAVHRNFSLLSSRFAVLDASSRSETLIDGDGLPNFYTFEENAISIPLEFVTLAGFPFMERMNDIISAFNQMGVTSRIHARYEALTAWRRARLLEATAAEQAGCGGRPLSLRHLQGGFLVLLAGYAGGALALALELFISCDYYHRVKQKILITLTVIYQPADLNKN